MLFQTEWSKPVVLLSRIPLLGMVLGQGSQAWNCPQDHMVGFSKPKSQEQGWSELVPRGDGHVGMEWTIEQGSAGKTLS